METVQSTASIVLNFMEDIWNQNRFDKLDLYLHPNFTDLSLPASFPSNKEGLERWVAATGNAFKHQTYIEEQVTEGERSVIKIKMRMTHIGEWRGIEATGLTVETIGYRYFRISDELIIEHQALIDGNRIESELSGVLRGCKVGR